jgi:hypothetical protein
MAGTIITALVAVAFSVLGSIAFCIGFVWIGYATKNARHGYNKHADNDDLNKHHHVCLWSNLTTSRAVGVVDPGEDPNKVIVTLLNGSPEPMPNVITFPAIVCIRKRNNFSAAGAGVGEDLPFSDRPKPS